MIRAADLIAKFRYALDNLWGYIYGKTHEMWSEEKQRAYAKENQGDPDKENSVLYGGKWAGHWVTDCSGLFKWAFGTLGGSIAHGSNSIWDKYCRDQGELRSGKRTDGKKLLPGTAVFTSTKSAKGTRHNHIGLYVGDGVVIEARGAVDGVTTSTVSSWRWTHWGELRDVNLSDGEQDSGKGTEEMKEATVVLPAGASGSTVNMREKADRASGIVTRVPVGSRVTVLSDQGEWCAVTYGDRQGWMMSNYLEYDGQGGEEGDDSIRVSADQQEEIDRALKAIEDACETIGKIIGRG